MFINIFFYLFMGALFCGAALAFLIKRKNPVSIVLLLSAGSAFLFLGAVVSGFNRESALSYILFLLVFLSLFTAVFVKPLWGIPPVVIFFTAVLVLYSPFNLGMRHFRNDQSVRIVFFPSGPGESSLKIEENGNLPESAILEGEAVYPMLFEIRFSPFLFFKRSSYMVITGFSSAPVYPDSRAKEPKKVYILRNFEDLDISRITGFPGITAVYPEQPLLRSEDYYGYTFHISKNGELEILDF